MSVHPFLPAFARPRSNLLRTRSPSFCKVFIRLTYHVSRDDVIPSVARAAPIPAITLHARISGPGSPLSQGRRILFLRRRVHTGVRRQSSGRQQRFTIAFFRPQICPTLASGEG